VVHLMIREGAPDITLRYIGESPKRLAISGFTEVQTQGVNIRRYAEYLLERTRGYRDSKTDYVRAGAGRMRKLTVDKGLLRQTEAVQDQIRALVRCDVSPIFTIMVKLVLTQHTAIGKSRSRQRNHSYRIPSTHDGSA
jgi:phosphatidylinositol-binding clathrin assembly protein